MAEPTNNETAAETSVTETQEEAPQARAKTDAKFLLAPLAKYAIVAVFMVAVIVSAAVLMNDDLDTIDEQVANIEAELVAQQPATVETDNAPQTEETVQAVVATESEHVATAADTTTEAPAPLDTESTLVNSENAVTENKSTESVATESATTESVDTGNQVTENAVSKPVATDAVTTTVSNETTESPFVSRNAERKARIAQHQAQIAQQDEEYLESFKSRQAEQIEWLRQQLVHQEQRIQQIEKRNQEVYEMRAANIRRMQQAREESLDRI